MWLPYTPHEVIAMVTINIATWDDELIAMVTITLQTGTQLPSTMQSYTSPSPSPRPNQVMQMT